MEQSSKRYLPRPKTQLRYGVTKMTIYRWENDPKMNFPKPLIINGRKYDDKDELDAWDHARLTGRAS
ncbi:putative DNA-binding transcriptional regulator AlpA [Devosia sp. UYZn731]|uniref:helix-turn-helix transcriptional regulator n=1 Tax=Devosia sp. UYZn731 TaxID=3156345 RepID=UPI00339ABCCB